MLCSLLGSGVGAGKGLDEASQAEGAIPIPIPIEVACQRHIAEAVREQQSVRDVEFRLHTRAQLKKVAWARDSLLRVCAVACAPADLI